VAAHPLVGIHNDHETVAEAVRRIAYMINVPHAFTPEYPTDETRSKPCKVPVILNVYDPYMFGSNGHDLAVDVEDAFETICQMTWCHQSQIVEWLPWVGRHDMAPPGSVREWSETLRRRFDRMSRELNLATPRALEVFTVTAWGEVPALEQLLEDFPNLDRKASRLAELETRLKAWRGARA
jgi:LmbE family N-acetylglucosaminyl deacetylase